MLEQACNATFMDGEYESAGKYQSATNWVRVGSRPYPETIG
jgi:hypothetical protein